MRTLNALRVQPLANTDDATSPFWSPDSREIGFFSKGRLKKIALAGGPTVSLCDVPDGRSVSWTRDNLILFPAPAPQHRGDAVHGLYWVAVQELLEREGFEVCLVNARGTKNLPGRKSDVQECRWLRKLHTYGLLRNSFQPPEEIRAVRTIWRQRDRLVKEAGREVQQMQKALTAMNIRLPNAISDVSGLTG
jgi:hypothetical protein